MSRSRSSRRKPALGPVVPLEDRANPAAAFALANNSLIQFDTANPSAVATAPITITGATAGETFVAIDVRPQNGMLYGLTSNGGGAVRLYAISTRSGVATPLTAGPVAFTDATSALVPIPGANFGFDFNPLVDRVRVVTDAGFNFRMDPNTGTLVDSDGDPATGVNPDAALNGGATSGDAAAYTNNAPSVGATSLYTLDAASDSLYLQNPPNGGTLGGGVQVTLGGNKLDFTAADGFDIPTGINVTTSNAAAAGKALAALTVGGATHLYAIELGTGAATDLGPIGSGGTTLQGFAVVNDLGGIPAIGLDATGANLVRFNTGTPATAAATVAITKVDAAEALVGIDYRPATGQLFGLGVNATADTATLYRIDPQTGVATKLGPTGSITFVNASGTTIDLPPAGAGYGFDFNPTNDRIRVVTGTGLNFRVNPNDGSAVDSDTATAGNQPDTAINGLPPASLGVSAAAYTNSFAQSGTPVATLYTLDADSNRLFIQNAPNAGTQTTGLQVTLGVAPLDFTAVNGFDIAPGIVAASSNTAAAGRGLALLTVGSKTGMYTIDLTTGAAKLVATLPDALAGASGLALGDAPAGTVTVSAASPVSEGAGSAPVVLTRTGGSTGPLTVTLSATGGTATPGTDFTGLPATVTFADGQTTLTASVLITDDADVEGDETITLAISAPQNSGVLGAPTTAAITITENDTTATTPTPVVVGGPQTGTAQVFAAGASGGLVPGAVLNAFADTPVDVRSAVADVNGDGTPDFVLVTGPGRPARVTVISGTDNKTVLLAPLDPFGSGFRGGAFVAAGDFNGDGRAEFVVTPDQGGGPNVAIFTLNADGTLATPKAFFALGNPGFRGGARVAIGDVNADGTPDLAVGAGFQGGPVVELHNGKAIAKNDFNTLILDGFFAFPGTDSETLRNGVFLAIGDLDGDGFGDLIAGGGPGGGPRVLTLGGKFLAVQDVGSAYAAPVTNFFFGADSTRGGVRVASADVDGDGRDDLVTGSGEALPARVGVFLGKSLTSATPAIDQDLTVFGGATLSTGVFVG